MVLDLTTQEGIKVEQYNADGRPQHNKDDPTRFREALAEELQKV